MAAQDICRLCDKVITSEASVITTKGLDNILKISAELQDGVDKKLLQEHPPITLDLLTLQNARTWLWEVMIMMEIEKVKLFAVPTFPLLISKHTAYIVESTWTLISIIS